VPKWITSVLDVGPMKHSPVSSELFLLLASNFSKKK
jgi:hypothetical protein